MDPVPLRRFLVWSPTTSNASIWLASDTRFLLVLDLLALHSNVLIEDVPQAIGKTVLTKAI